ncbi:MAG: MFS transporter [Armatimonadetes bacterium]|nr:MFS transporter [Armatimonadota bacterium]
MSFAYGDRSGIQKWLVLAAASTGLILGILDTTVVNIAVPALMRDLQASVMQVSWVLNGYSLGQAALFLTLGRLAERYGRRLIFVSSLVLFTLFSFACGLAPSVGWLVVFRVGQAVGAAGIVPISLIILLSAFPPAQHGLATGLWGAFGTLAGIIGPPVGGLLLQYASWRWIFFINVPIGIVAIGVSLLVVPELRRDTRAGGVDCLGIALSAGAIGCLILAIAEGNDWGWSSPTVLGLLAAALIFGSLFVWLEGRTKQPMVPIALFHVRLPSRSPTP